MIRPFPTTRRWLPHVVVALALLVGAGIAGLLVLRSGSGGPAPGGALPANATRGLPRAGQVKPALDVPTPTLLGSGHDLTYFAALRAATVARRAPSLEAPIVARLEATTPEGTTNIVDVLARMRDRAGRLWVQASLPILPNNSTGWILRRDLTGYGTVRTRLVVSLERREATLYRSGRPVLRAPVGVGRPQWPTPKGTFYVRDVLTRFKSPFYGPLAFGTSARSATLTDWPGGGFIGIHGTSQPKLLPGAVSHGCIRMRNADILRLGKLMSPGTPVRIV